YLINPAGVVFGPDAMLDVKGSFAVTTADIIKLSDGGHFDVHDLSNSLLTTAAPAAFGFLGKPAAVTIKGASLGVSTGNLTIAADSLLIDGRISALSISPLNIPAGTITLSAHAIQLGNSGEISSTTARADGAGIHINAESFVIDGGQVFTKSYDPRVDPGHI